MKNRKADSKMIKSIIKSRTKVRQRVELGNLLQGYQKRLRFDY